MALPSPFAGGSSPRPQATERAISHRASLQDRFVVRRLPLDHSLDDLVQPSPLRVLPPRSERSGHAEGSSTSCANSTARQAASGRRAHHRCSVEG